MELKQSTELPMNPQWKHTIPVPNTAERQSPFSKHTVQPYNHKHTVLGLYSMWQSMKWKSGERECVCGCGARACVRACILALVYMRACKCVYVYAVYTIWACVLSAEYPVWMGEVADFPETEGVQLQIQSVPFPTSGMWPNVQGMTSRGVWPLKSRVWEWKQQTVEMSV